jgi:hypothetical protein
MSTFRRYGGVNFSASNNVIKSYISNSDQMNINNYSGLENSKESFKSHIDMSGNSILHLYSVQFQDGTVQTSALPSGSQGLPGPPGPQGAQGSLGLQGAQGATGAEGAQGLQGVQGAQGYIGVQGPQGLKGDQGPQGVQGLQGVQGAQGYIGVQGPQGLKGTTGSQGLQGDAGPQGDIGQQGLQGVQGAQGFQGVQGAQGDIGVQGQQGLQGVQGAQGDVGDVGAQGAQGDAGAQGAQGGGDSYWVLNSPGNISYAGNVKATQFNATSDYRIKKNIIPLELNKYSIDNLNPVVYENKHNDKLNVGLIAHELQEVMDFLVNGEKDGDEIQSVNYLGIISILIKEVQELKKRISKLEL